MNKMKVYTWLILMIFQNIGITQNKMYLEIDFLGRNAEYYKYLKYTPYSPKISDFENITISPFDFAGTPNFSFYLKYKMNKHITWSLGYETFLISEKLPIHAHLFCQDCVNSYEFNNDLYTRNFPLHFELELPKPYCFKKFAIIPVIGFNTIYNKENPDISITEANLQYVYNNVTYAINKIRSETETKRHWNFGLRYGCTFEYRIYREIRINFTLLAQKGLKEVKRTSFEIEHSDLLFNQQIFDNGLWVNKQSLLSKRFGITIPLDWLGEYVKYKTLKKLFEK